MITFSDGGKHVWLATAATEGLLARKRTAKIAEIVQNQSRGYPRDQGQTTGHSGNYNSTYTRGEHGAVPPSPASSASVPAPGKRFGATHNPSAHPNAPQPGTFHTVN